MAAWGVLAVSAAACLIGVVLALHGDNGWLLVLVGGLSVFASVVVLNCQRRRERSDRELRRAARLLEALRWAEEH